MTWLSITLTDLFDDKSKDLTFTYSTVKSCRNGLEIYKQLNPDDLNNYINLPYLFRFIVNKHLKTKKIPYKPLFFKMLPIYEGARLRKRCPVRSFRQMSFDDFYGGLIDFFEFPGIIEKIETGYYSGFPNITYKQGKEPFLISFQVDINEILVKQAYEYFQAHYEKTTIKESKNLCLNI